MGGGLFASSAYWYGNRIGRFDLRIERISLPIAGLSPALAGMRIVQLSDFHMSDKAMPPFFDEAIRAANDLQPDIIVLTGDYVSKRVRYIFDIAPQLSRLRARLGVFAVLGNHDFHEGFRTIQWALENAGITVWRNQGTLIEENGGRLFLGGLDDGRFGRPDAELTLCSCPPDTPAILLMHEPDLATDVARFPQVKALLCGHTHGGQIRLPWLGTPKPFLPALGRKYLSGIFKIGEMWLYVNDGIGTSYVLTARYDVPPEITEFTLMPA